MNNLETNFTIIGAGVACLFGVYYLNKKGINHWSNKSNKDIANEFSTANKRDQKRMLNELSAKQIKDMHDELRSINDSEIAHRIQVEETYEEWVKKNNQEVDDRREQVLNKLLENYSHESFLSKKIKNTGKGKHKRSKKHKRR